MLSASSQGAIGIFDSGIGGLTVARAIRKLLPGEDIIYYGDTAHLPYGDKSASAIKHYGSKITSFLLSKGCKVVVVACNTASSYAFAALQKEFKDRILINVIDPVVIKVSKQYKQQKVGVIGTHGTVQSRVYPRKFKQLGAPIQVVSTATPLLAPMIEEGFFNHHISCAIIDEYLSNKRLRNISALILGCTHYPLIKDEIKAYYGDSAVDIIDAENIVAAYTRDELKGQALLSTKKKGSSRFYLSDYTSAFEASAKQFFQDEVHFEQLNLWDA